MSLSSVYPKLSPTLLLNFSNSKILDSRVTFSRETSSGTVLGTSFYYDGKSTTKAEQNLLIHSQELDNVAWVTSNLTVSLNSAIAPDGTTTSETLSASGANATLTQSVLLNSGNHTISAWIKRVSGSGSIQMSVDSAGTWSTVSITSSWNRYSVTQNLIASGNKTAGIRIVSGGDQIEIWGVQLEERSTASYYITTTTFPITTYLPLLIQVSENIPRLQHDPITGDLLGLLIEKQSTNLLTYSSDFSNPSYVKTNVSVITGSSIAPDGTITSNKVYIDSVTASNVFVFVSKTISAGVAYSISVFAKANELNYLFLGINTSATEYAVAQFNLITGNVQFQSDTSLTTPGYELLGSSVDAVGNNWYRCQVVVRSPNTSENIMISPASLPWNGTIRPGTNQNGNGFSGIQLWGAQLEESTNVTSYIPTISTAITRVADTAYVTGNNNFSWLNNSGGTILTESYNFIPLSILPVLSLDDNTTTNEVKIYINNSAGYFFVNKLNVPQANITGSTFNRGVKIIMAATYKNNNFYISVNNDGINSDTIGSVPEGLTFLRIGADKAGNYFNGIVSKIAFYSGEISTTEIQSLTTNNLSDV